MGKFIQESPKDWEKRHQDHVTEELTPEIPFETRSLFCHCCKEYAEWKGFIKLPSGNS